jgi:hypothetical protein
VFREEGAGEVFREEGAREVDSLHISIIPQV